MNHEPHEFNLHGMSFEVEHLGSPHTNHRCRRTFFLQYNSNGNSKFLFLLTITRLLLPCQAVHPPKPQQKRRLHVRQAETHELPMPRQRKTVALPADHTDQRCECSAPAGGADVVVHSDGSSGGVDGAIGGRIGAVTLRHKPRMRERRPSGSDGSHKAERRQALMQDVGYNGHRRHRQLREDRVGRCPYCQHYWKMMKTTC